MYDPMPDELDRLEADIVVEEARLNATVHPVAKYRRKLQAQMAHGLPAFRPGRLPGAYGQNSGFPVPMLIVFSQDRAHVCTRPIGRFTHTSPIATPGALWRAAPILWESCNGGVTRQRRKWWHLFQDRQDVVWRRFGKRAQRAADTARQAASCDGVENVPISATNKPVNDRKAHDAKVILDIVRTRPSGVSRPAPVISGTIHVMGVPPEFQIRCLKPQCPGISQLAKISY